VNESTLQAALEMAKMESARDENKSNNGSKSNNNKSKKSKGEKGEKDGGTDRDRDRDDDSIASVGDMSKITMGENRSMMSGITGLWAGGGGVGIDDDTAVGTMDGSVDTIGTKGTKGDKTVTSEITEKSSKKKKDFSQIMKNKGLAPPNSKKEGKGKNRDSEDNGKWGWFKKLLNPMNFFRKDVVVAETEEERKLREKREELEALAAADSDDEKEEFALDKYVNV